MGSCCSCIDGDLDGPVLWYQPGTQRSLSWCNRQTGFGYRRTKSYRQIAVGEKVDMNSVNREGNLSGDLSGRIVVYNKASKKADYSTFPENPSFNIHEGEKLYVKAFFPAPLHRIPIGENNILRSNDVKGRGAAILAPVPQAVAIFMDIDGVAQSHEHFCKDSLTGREREIRGDDKSLKKRKVGFSLPTTKPDGKSNGSDVNGNEIKAKGELLTTAVKGSFYTFVLSDGQLPFCFLHLPLIGNLHDTNISTGYYGENLIRCFCDVIRTLPPGMHKIDLGVRVVFDHMEYNYLVLGVGTNALGKWRKKIPNSLLKEPYEKPEIVVCSRALAKGGFTINISIDSNIEEVLAGLDRKPPKEIYNDTDSERIRKIARVSFEHKVFLRFGIYISSLCQRTVTSITSMCLQYRYCISNVSLQTVAAGKYCEIFNVSGLPDWVVLSSGENIGIMYVSVS